jgi:ParB-like chromosome segregation protein Spo0J
MPKAPTIEQWPIGKIKPYAQNNKIHTDASVKKLAGLINEFGFDQPIVITPDGEIIKGHRRYLAAQYLKLKTVPVIVRDDLTPEQIKAARIADNAVSDDSDYDYGAIAADLQALVDADYDLLLTGLDNADDILGALESIEPGKPKAKDTSKTMGDRAKTVKPVLYVEQVEIFERAIRQTGIKNRGKALQAICEAYLNDDFGAAGQFDFPE